MNGQVKMMTSNGYVDIYIECKNCGEKIKITKIPTKEKPVSLKCFNCSGCNESHYTYVSLDDLLKLRKGLK